MAANEKTLILDSTNDVYSIIKGITEKSSSDEPFYLCDIDNLIGRVENWRALMPRVDIFYAVKCNPSRVILETFAALGTGFDCASKEEIRTMIELGVPPNKIIFSNTTKLVSHLTYAAEVNVTAMTFDNELELHKIKKHHPKAELVLRIRHDDSSALISLGEKCGALPNTEASHLLEIAKSLNLNVIGVHFHIGFGSENYVTYYNAIAEARKVFDVGSELGYDFKLLDLGGGYPGEKAKPIDEIAKFINKGIDDHFSDGTVKIIAEPGKYCCNTAFKLVSQVHSKKVVTDTDKQNIMNYYVDVSVYNAFFNVLYGIWYECRPVKSGNETQVHPSIIWGPTLEDRDKLTEKFHYLPELYIGDWIIFEENGAYSVSINCEYNGFSSPRVYAVIEKDKWLMLTENLPEPISKDRFTTSLECLLKERDIPYSYRREYF